MNGAVVLFPRLARATRSIEMAAKKGLPTGLQSALRDPAGELVQRSGALVNALSG